MTLRAAAPSLWAPAAVDGEWIEATGMAINYQGNGLGTLPPDEGAAVLALAPDGMIEIACGLDEMGQGLIPALQAAVAAHLGCARGMCGRSTAIPGRRPMRGPPRPRAGGSSSGRRRRILHTACGPVIDVARHPGQMEGGLVQGLGFTLTEDPVMAAGRFVARNLDTDLLPALADAPERMLATALEALDPGDPFGPRGAGEIGIRAVTPAITNAVAAACGVWPAAALLDPAALLPALESPPQGGRRPPSPLPRLTPREYLENDEAAGGGAC